MFQTKLFLISMLGVALTVIVPKGFTQSLPEKIAPRAEEVTPIGIGQKVPAVEVIRADGRRVNLSAEIIGKPTILIFYRGGWCPYCNTHLGKLAEIQNNLIQLGMNLVAICPDRPQILENTIKKHQLKFTVYSDSSMQAAAAFGLAFRVDDATLEKYKEYGIDLEEASGYSHHLLPVPAAYVIDREGVIRFLYYNPDYKVRVEPKALLDEAMKVSGKGFQDSEKND